MSQYSGLLRYLFIWQKSAYYTANSTHPDEMQRTFLKGVFDNFQQIFVISP